MEEIIVMVGYKPKEGKAKQLQQLMREYLPVFKTTKPCNRQGFHDDGSERRNDH